jgi:DNA-binding GntR family transcriptional regulator
MATKRVGRVQPASTERSAATKPVATPPTMSRGEWLADIVKDRILNGVYQPGERILESDLQQEFSFSNGPVREALQLVVAATLAERSPWQGVRVVTLTSAEIGELFQVRTALLEYIAERAASFGSKETLVRGADLKRRLKATFAEAASTGTSPAFSGELSAWLLEGAGNSMLRQMWDSITLRSRIYVNDALRKKANTESLDRLSDLIDAVGARDPQKARQAARALTQHLLIQLDVDTKL